MRIKNFIKKIPMLGGLAKYCNYLVFHAGTKFRNSREYWENRYASGGNSGDGSYNKLAKFKAEFLNDFVADNNIQRVIEYGVGDGNQLKLASYPSYIGYDVSINAINICRNLFQADKAKSFQLMDDYQNESADLTLSLDVIYHLVEDEVFDAYMRRLFLSSNRYVIIYSSNASNADYNNNCPHVRHRVFTDWIKRNMPIWKLMEHKKNRYPFDPNDNSAGSFADFYVFSK